MFLSVCLPFYERRAGIILFILFALLLIISGSLNAATPNGDSVTTMRTADRADLAMDTGLWRGEFLKSSDDEASDGSGPSDEDNHRTMQALRATEVIKHSDSVNLKGIAEEYFEDGESLPMESADDQVLAVVEMPEHLSDWEQAICNVTDGKAAAGQKGPSVITAIVAVVGVIVVVGAYLKK